MASHILDWEGDLRATVFQCMAVNNKALAGDERLPGEDAAPQDKAGALEDPCGDGITPPPLLPSQHTNPANS